MATILDENILFQAPHLRQSTSHSTPTQSTPTQSTPTQSTPSSFNQFTLLYDQPDSFTELLDPDDFDDPEDPTPSTQLDLADDSDTGTHVKKPASQTGTE